MQAEALVELLSDLKREFGCRVEFCGSRVTCDPPPANTDLDVLVEIVDDKPNHGASQKVTDVVALLSVAGFGLDSSAHYQVSAVDGFMSWKKGEVNLLVSANPEWCARHRLATALCKKLNLLHKPDRIAVFQAFLYGKSGD